MTDWAVIFDVDGVLLELTRDEEEIFFHALRRFVPTQDLSRDWNSYRIRNDDDIIAEILERKNLPHSLKPDVVDHYIALLNNALQTNLQSVVIAGASELLSQLATNFTLAIATANLLDAAAARLQQVGLWSFVSRHAQGADGGGHKSIILKRLLGRINLPGSNVIYIGDNLNDVEAGRSNGVHFIGFSTNPQRLQALGKAGAQHLSADHRQTAALLSMITNQSIIQPSPPLQGGSWGGDRGGTL